MSKLRNNNSPGRRILRSLKWIVPLLIVAALVALAFVPKPIDVDAGEVTSEPMVLTIDDDGVTRVRERYVIAAPLSGRLMRIGLDPGDELMEGDVLAVIDPGAPTLLDPRTRAQAAALVKAAEAAVDRAETQLAGREVEREQLEAAYERNKGLYERGNVAAAAFEQSEAAFLAAKHIEQAAASAVDIAEFELEQARAALLHSDKTTGDTPDDAEGWAFTIRSPIKGTVLAVHEESSRVVQAGTPLLEVGDPSALEMSIDVLSQDGVNIRAGQKVIVEHWGGAEPLTGRVRLVEPSAYTKVSALGVDEQRVNVIADFDGDTATAGSLGDGFRIEARIVIWETDDALQVPAGALFRQGDDWAVYRVDGDRAQLVTIETGRNNGDQAEVLSGLSSGDRVILHPGDRIAEGTLIKPRG